MKPEKRQELTERDIKDLLTSTERLVPPAGLADRIKQEIPVDLPAMPGLVEDGARPRPLSRSRIWLMAASVMIAVGGGFFAFRLMEQMPPPGDEAAMAVPAGSIGVEQTEVTRGVVERSAPSPEAEIADSPAAGSPVAVTRDAVASTDESLEASGDRAGIDLRRSRAEVDRDTSQTLKKGSEATGRQLQGNRLGRLAESVSPEPVLESTRRPPPPPPPPPSSPVSRPPVSRVSTAAPVPSESQELGGVGDDAAERPKVQEVVVESDSIMTEYDARSRPASPRAKRKVAPPTRPPSRERKDVRDEEHKALTEVDTTHYNYRVEEGNAQIRSMEKEARSLEAELQALEASSSSPSTGGTAEPNDAPYGDVFFDSAGTNPFIDTEDDARSTFGLDVDTGSYTVVRRYLRDGYMPPPEAVRVEELINYLDYGDAAPERREFAIHAEGGPSIYGQGDRYHLLRFNLSGRELDDADRRPALLTFVIDVSGSMRQENRLGLVKQALALLIEQLRSDDRLALVIYGSRGQVVLEPTSDHRAIRSAIDSLTPGGSTNASEGLELGYELTARHRRQGAINRVILCSDGVANVGATSAGSILERIRREADQGIELTTVGFGMGNYNDTLMEQLADTGNGRYAYVDNLDEARRIFVENLTGTLQTLAAEARVQVEFNPEVVSRYRLLGYENRDIADERFRDDSVDAGEIGVGHKVTALYEIKTERKLRAADQVGTLRLRYGSVDTGKVIEVDRAVTGADFVTSWEAASPALKLTSLVAEYAEILKRTYWAREGDLDDVFRRAQRVSADFAGDREVADFVSLVAQAAKYRERESP